MGTEKQRAAIFLLPGQLCDEIKTLVMGLDFTFQNYQEGYLKCEFMPTVINKELHSKGILWHEISVCDTSSVSSVWYMFYHACNLFAP